MGELATIRTMDEYVRWREQQPWYAEQRLREASLGRAVAYSGQLPTAPGYYVYRLWGGAFSESGCLYVGMVGESGPRRLSARLAEHKRDKPWWDAVTHVDAGACDMYNVAHEEALQIATLRPDHNRRTEGYRLTHREAAEAQGWPDQTVAREQAHRG